MMKSVPTVVFACIAILALTLALVRADAPAPAAAKVIYINKSCGFSINPPDYSAPDTGNYIPVAFTAPAKNNFCSNINVGIQMRTVTRQQYLDTTRAEVMQAHGKINSIQELMVSGCEAAIVDCEAKMNNQEFHFLTLIVIAPNRVYIVTCTAQVKEFAAQKADFEKCLESFKLEAEKI